MAQYHFRTTNIKMNWWQFSLSVSKETHLRLEGWDVTKEPSRALLHNFQWLLLVEIFQIHLNFLIDTVLYSLHSLWLFYWLWMVPLGLQTVETVQIDLAGTLVASLWSWSPLQPYFLMLCNATTTIFCTIGTFFVHFYTCSSLFVPISCLKKVHTTLSCCSDTHIEKVRAIAVLRWWLLVSRWVFLTTSQTPKHT